MVKKRGLGRGLDALLGGSQSAASVQQEESPAATVQGPTTSLAVDLIQRGRYQPRRNFDEDRLRELADSISAQGMVQPIVVRPVADNRYE
ncbi:MAG: ParB N-terminal domain-containing protein, partial [Gammaproteobacteria bacterium]|nr:ParB N-terminal domain-containing protein [Gammaproteobacteria bacterium]